jgi:hypothetical protein
MVKVRPTEWLQLSNRLEMARLEYYAAQAVITSGYAAVCRGDFAAVPPEEQLEKSREVMERWYALLDEVQVYMDARVPAGRLASDMNPLAGKGGTRHSSPGKRSYPLPRE